MRTFSQIELRTYLTCRRRHQFSYTRMLKKPKVSKALRYGTAWHNAMHNLYGKGMKLEDVIDHAVADIIPPPLENDDEEYVLNTLQVEQERAKIRGHITAYYKNYRGMEEWKDVYTTELDFEVPSGIIINGQELGYKGRFDMIATDVHGKHWLVEHKTSADLNLDTAANLRLDFQTSFYLLAATLMHRADPKFPKLEGVIYNVTKKSGLRAKQKVYDTLFSNKGWITGESKARTKSWAKAQNKDRKDKLTQVKQEERSEGEYELAARVQFQMENSPERFFLRATARIDVGDLEFFGLEMSNLAYEIENVPNVVPNYQECKFCQFKMICSNPRDIWDSLISSSYIVKSPADKFALAQRS